MIILFSRGDRIQWKTVDDAVHVGTVQQVVVWGYRVAEDDRKGDVYVSRGSCTRYEEPKGKKK